MKKKIIAIILSVATVLSMCSIPAFAVAPSDYNDPKCIDTRALGYGTDYISLPLKEGEKVCGCKTCTVDAVMFNRLEDYVDDLEKRYESLETTDKVYFENKIQQRNIETILTSLSNAINYKEYKNSDFFIASTDYNRRSEDVKAFFLRKMI